MKPTRASLILFLGFAIIFLLSVAVYPVMAADPGKTQPDAFNITDIPALPGGAGENNPVNVTVSNTTEVMDPEDRTKGPGTGTGTEPSPSVAPEVTGTSATTQPVTEATTNVSVTGTESPPSVAPEVTVAETGTQVPVTEATTNVSVTGTESPPSAAPEVTGTSATTQPVTEATPNVQVTETPAESLVHETFESALAKSGPGYFSAAEPAMQSERSWGSTASPTSQDVTPLWSNIGGNFSSAPVIYNGLVYISSEACSFSRDDNAGSTYVLDLHTGRYTQRLFGSGQGGRGGPAFGNGMGFVGSSNYGFLAWTPGNLSSTFWMFSTGSSVATKPFVMNDRVYFSDFNNIYAFTAESGREQWRYDSCGPVCSAPQGANGVVYFSDNDKIYARNAITGDEIWTVSTNDPSIRPHTTSPVVVNGVLYFGSGHNLYAFDATTGKKIWSYDAIGEIYYSPTVANGVVYVGSDPHDIHAVNANSGQKIWTITQKFASSSSFAVADGVAYFGNGHDLYAVNAADGRTLWQYTVGDAWVGSPAIADGILVVGADPGQVYAFDLSQSMFTGTPQSGDAPLTVQFTDTTAGSPTSWNWKFGDGGSSSLQNPSHVYNTPGNYRVTLVTSGPTGSHTTARDDYITVTGTANTNVVVFGNPESLSDLPDKLDYRSLGGDSAIRRGGAVETFIGTPELPGNDWVQVTNGAAITTNGDLATWTPGSSGPVTIQKATASKQYVGISQFSDWLLAIYEDATGATHLEVSGNAAGHPNVFNTVPTGTGWKMISAGNNHALALHNDGTLVAWGDDTYGQLQLPNGPKNIYSDIDAGRDFSLGLAVSDSGNQLRHGGSIYARGKDDFGQVTGMNSLTPGDYIAIAAGTTRAAAIAHDGTIITKGETWTGTQPPVGAGFTDIALGPDNGFAIKESAPELTITGPFIPGKPIECLQQDLLGAENLIIPYGSTIEYTNHEITRIFRPNGTQIGWANDREAKTLPSIGGTVLKGSHMIIAPSGSAINITSHTTIEISNITTQSYVLQMVDHSSLVTTSAPARDHHPISLGNNLPHPDQFIRDTSKPVNWVEGANMTFNDFAPPSQKIKLGTFSAKWDVPDLPDTEVDDANIVASMGLTPSPDVIANNNVILKNSLMYNWNKDGTSFAKPWSAGIWYVRNGAVQSKAILVPSGGIKKGDTLNSKIEYNPGGSSKGYNAWVASLDVNGNNLQTLTMINPTKDDYTWTVRPDKSEAIFSLESGTADNNQLLNNGYNDIYFFKNIRITDIKITDMDRHQISSNFAPLMNDVWYAKMMEEGSKIPDFGVYINSVGKTATTIGGNNWIQLDTHPFYTGGNIMSWSDTRTIFFLHYYNTMMIAGGFSQTPLSLITDEPSSYYNYYSQTLREEGMAKGRYKYNTWSEDTPWHSIESTQVGLLAHSPNLRIFATADPALKGGSPSDQTNDRSEFYVGTLIATFNVLDAAFGIMDRGPATAFAITDLIKQITAYDPSGDLWDQRWNHCTSTYQVVYGRLTDAHHALEINTYTQPNSQYETASGAAEASFSIYTKVEYYDPEVGDTSLRPIAYFKRDKIDPTPKTETPNFDDDKFAFYETTSVVEWESAMEAW